MLQLLRSIFQEPCCGWRYGKRKRPAFHVQSEQTRIEIAGDVWKTSTGAKDLFPEI